MVTVPTPEEAADLSDRIVKALLDNQTRVRTLFRRWLILASIIVLAGMGYTGWQSYDSNATTSQVRNSQMINTKASNHRDACAQAAYSDLAYDLKVIVSPGETPNEFLSQVKIPGAKC
jgi:hypothetical protein